MEAPGLAAWSEARRGFSDTFGRSFRGVEQFRWVRAFGKRTEICLRCRLVGRALGAPGLFRGFLCEHDLMQPNKLSR